MAITTIGTMNIIQTKPSVLPVWWMAWIAILLVAFAAPSLIARFVLMPGDEARISLLKGEKIGDDDLEKFYLTRRRAAAWFPENALYNDLSLAAIERATRTKDQEQVRSLYREAELWERKALNVSPADPYGWYRLAYLNYVTEGATKHVADAWSMSLSTAPYEPRLVYPRLEMAMSLGLMIDVNAEIHIPRLIREAWDDHPDRLAGLAEKANYIPAVENALKNDPEALADFLQKVGKQPAKK